MKRGPVGEAIPCNDGRLMRERPPASLMKERFLGFCFFFFSFRWAARLEADAQAGLPGHEAKSMKRSMREKKED